MLNGLRKGGSTSRRANALLKAGSLIIPLSVLASGTGHAQERPISWQGAYVSLNRVSPIRSLFDRPDLNVGLLAIVGIGKRYSFQVQYLQPITGPSAPLLRIGIDWRMF